MLPTFVIGLREGVEAALIVGIVAAFLGRHGRRDALRWVWTGVGLAIALSFAIGIALDAVQKSLAPRQQEAIETAVGAIAVAFITYMIAWMRRHARDLRRSLEQAAAEALARNSVIALVVMAFLAVLREGFETAIFTLAVFNSASNRTAAGAGLGLGLAASIALGVALYRGGVRINLSRFFRVTGVVLVFVAGGLLANTLRGAHEAGWYNALQTQVLDLSWLVAPGTVRAALLTSMLGIQADPTLAESLGWLLYIVVVGLFVIWPARHGPARPDTRRRWRALGRATVTSTIALIAALLLASCGGTNAGDSASATNANVIDIKLTKAGCEPASLQTTAGPTTIKVVNDGAPAVSEFELLDGTRVLGEVENLTPGLSGKFSLDLKPGTYKTSCPGGTTSAEGTLTVSGEDGGVTRPDLIPAVDNYRAYVQEQMALLLQQTTAFADAVTRGDLAAAKQIYPTARQPYERVEPVAETFGALDPAIDGREGDVPTEQWGGFHRIERAIWIDGSLAGMAPVAQQLVTDVQTLQSQAEALPLDAAQIANGALGLMNEVSKSKITGEEERYSRTDLYDFYANLEGSRSAFQSLEPIVRARDTQLADEITSRFTAVETQLAAYRSGDGFVAYDQLTQAQTRDLAQLVDMLAEPLSQLAETILNSAGEG